MFKATIPGARTVGAPNFYESRGRERKVRALVGVIDLLAAENDIDPIRDPLRVVAKIKVRGADPAWWESVAKVAGVNPPSDPSPAGLTVKAVIGVYFDRAAQSRRRSS